MKVKRVEKEPSSVDSFILKFEIGQLEILRSQVRMSVPLCVRFFCGNLLFVHVCTLIFISYFVSFLTAMLKQNSASPYIFKHEHT